MDKLERYIEEHSLAEDALLAELDRATNQRVIQPKMVSGRVQGAFLKLITEILQPKLVLEIGTFTGYSALSIAAGLGDGKNHNTGRVSAPNEDGESHIPELHTIEVDDELEDLARSFFERSPHGPKIRLHIGSALEVVPELARQLGRPFDMVFIDGDKREYPDYYRMLMGDGGGASAENSAIPMVRSGGIILADNVLWYGKVAEAYKTKSLTPYEKGANGGGMAGTGGRKNSADRQTAGILEFNRLVAEDDRVENVILPLRDGINLIRVK